MPLREHATHNRVIAGVLFMEEGGESKEQRLSWSGDRKASRSRELERGHERGIL